MKTLLVLALLAVPLAAQPIQPQPLPPKPSKTLPILLAASAGLDIASSWNRQELNPILGRSRFGARQAAIKISLNAIPFLYGTRTRRGRKLAILYTAINLAAAGHNFARR